MAGQKTFLPKMNRVTSAIGRPARTKQPPGVGCRWRQSWTDYNSRQTLRADCRSLRYQFASPAVFSAARQGPNPGVFRPRSRSSYHISERDGWEPWRRNGLFEEKRGCRPSKRRRSAAPDFRALLARVVVGSAPRDGERSRGL